ncbi:MAG: hypothetical protein FWF79_05425 [Defluviitaleaceae bacterium]|nr:hypothetical protein [Defluviitaleaceae bacterium]
MDISSVSQLVSGVGNPANPSEQSNSLLEALQSTSAPEAGEGAGTDFGAAGAYQQGQQAAMPETFAPDTERVAELWNSHQQRVNSFRQMIETLLGQQAERQSLADGWSPRDIEITPEMRADAEAMIAEGGYFSVEETASRMLDFAVALTGGDPAQIDVMRDAVQRGFDQAERMFGGELPQISHDTLQAVMDGFDEWAEAGSASAITLLNRV